MTMNDTNMNEAKIDGTNHAENISINEQKGSKQSSDLVVGTAWFIAFLFFMTAWMYFTA
jgi:hypothetical protein